MNNKRVRTKAMAMAVAAAMAVELCPVTAFAVTGDQVAADGTYSKTAHVSRTSEDDENEDIWSEYNVKVSITSAETFCALSFRLGLLSYCFPFSAESYYSDDRGRTIPYRLVVY